MARFQSSIRSSSTVSAEYNKPKRPWQAYVLASLMVAIGFLFANAVFDRLTESKLAPSLAQETKVEESEPTEEPQVAENKDESEPVAVTKPKAPQPIYNSTYPAPPETSETIASSQPDAPVLSGFSAPKTDVATSEETAEPTEEAALTAPQAETQAPESLDTTEETSDQVEVASAVVSGFYEDLDSGNLGSAYDKLGSEFQHVLTFDRFRDGYSQTENLSCEIKNTELLADDLVRLDVQIAVTESGVPTQYYATCLVAKEGREWALAGVVQLEG